MHKYIVDEHGFVREGPKGQPMTASDTCRELNVLTERLASACLIWDDFDEELKGYDEDDPAMQKMFEIRDRFDEKLNAGRYRTACIETDKK